MLRPSRRHLALERLEARTTPATFTWTGLGAFSTWGDGGNWEGGSGPAQAAPGTTLDLVFPAGAQKPVNFNNLPTNTVINSITIQGVGIGGTPYSISEDPDATVNSIVLGTGSPSSGNFTVQPNAGTVTYALPTTLAANGDQSISVGGSGSVLSIAAPVGGSALNNLNKDGIGRLILPAANPNLVGGVKVNAGVLEIGNAQSLGPVGGAGTVVAVNSTVALNNVAGGDIGEQVWLNGAGFDADEGALFSQAGANTWAGSVILDSNSSIGADSSLLFVTGPVSDTGGGAGLTKVGGASLSLSGTNTYRGGTVLRNGQIEWSGDAALGTGPVQLGDAQSPAGYVPAFHGFPGGTLANDIAVNRPGTILGSNSGANAPVTYAGTLTLNMPALQALFVNAGSPGGTYFSGRITGLGDVVAWAPGNPGGVIVLDNATGTPNDFHRAGTGCIVTVEDGAVLQLNVSPTKTQLPADTTVFFRAGDATLQLANPAGTGGGQTIGAALSLADGAGRIRTATAGAFTLTIDAVTSTNFSGLVTDGVGTLSLHKLGTVPDTLESADIDGGVTVAEGDLAINGTMADGAAVDDVAVSAGGTLSGVGTVAGTVHVLGGGTVVPGTVGTGILTLGNLVADAGGAVAVWVNGPTAGTQHDQLHVTGAVTLGGGPLQVGTDLVGPLPPGMTVVIVNNDGNDPVGGTFAGLSEGAAVTVNGQTLTISYAGGDGNDVTLTTTTNPPPPPANTPPTIADIPNQPAVLPGTTIGPLPFTVGDNETPTAGLLFQWSSSNAALVPSGSVGIGGSGSNRTVTVTPAAGQTGTATITVTVTDGGGLSASDTFTVTVFPPLPPVTVAPSRNLVAGGTANGGAAVFVPAANGQYAESPVATLSPFSGFSGQVRTTQADVNGDGTPDTVLVTGPGAPLRVAVVSGANNSTVLVQPFDPFGGDFTGGGFLAAADLDGDGRAEFVVTPDQGGGPRVSIFSLVNGTATVKGNFLGIDDANFRGGCRAALGDVNKDGTPDVAVSAGFLGGPRTALFDGTTVFTTPTRLTGDFFAFPGSDATTLRNGVFVAAGDIDGDGFADLVFGGGPGGAPRVFVLSGALVAAGNVAGAQASPIANFFVAGNSNDRGGVRLAVKDADGDNKADVIAGSGEGSAANVRVYLGKNFTSAGEPGTFQNLSVFGGELLPGGVFVG